jgi:ATP-dependent DNA helicase RecQ
MLAAAVLRKPVLVIVPLQALQADLLRRCAEVGLNAATLPSVDQRSFTDGPIIYVTSPEWFVQNSATLPSTIALLVFDEVHTLSKWSFRTSFEEAHGDLLRHRPPVLAMTATLLRNDQDKTINRLRLHNPYIHRVPVLPEHVRFIVHLEASVSIDSVTRLYGDRMRSCKTVVFVNTKTSIRESDEGRDPGPFITHLQSKKIDALSLHGDMSKAKKSERAAWFRVNPHACLIATDAFGMGVDVGGIDLVIMLEAPPDVETLLQRAGRARSAADCVIFAAEHTDRRQLQWRCKDAKGNIKPAAEVADICEGYSVVHRYVRK